jgi:hypothetical protein
VLFTTSLDNIVAGYSENISISPNTFIEKNVEAFGMAALCLLNLQSSLFLPYAPNSVELTNH